MPNAIVLMTALVPTVGHKYLIDYAKNLLQYVGDQVHVIVGTMDCEPVDGYLRYKAIKDTYANNWSIVVHRLDRDVPQNPSEHPDFWNLWRDIVREFVDVKPDDYFVASELYGMDMAEVLGCKFMPCNRYRETVPVKGTGVRQDLTDSFDQILPAFQKHIRKTVTVFGAESCGKTTMTRALAKELNGHFVPEWAREYLETVGADVTDDRMQAIVRGQAALQRTARDDLFNKPFVFQDTDLFSTLGYYRLWNGGTDHDVDLCEYLAKQLKSDFYIVMNDGIPFEANPLRYGGDKRESGMQYWIDLLEEYKLPYYVVPLGTHQQQLNAVCRAVIELFEDSHKHIKEYVR
jgi:HTH-type transcriptional regulator, transcriptional repressor of NAD biosynthesis genes